MNINVTKPFLPPLAEYQAYLEGVWRREWLTNHGPLVNELELRLKEHLGLEHLLFLANGTIALQIAIKALDLKGEVITTPFSYVATTSALVWEGCRPVMVDICPRSLNINPALIETAITEKTTAILATHVFGNPCDIEAIEQLAASRGLKVIYDAAHAFGTSWRGQSLFGYGDVATASFHTTKLFHTVEGGAVITPSPQLLKKMAQLRNFGHVSATEFGEVGINGKNSEFHAAMGLCNLNYVAEILAVRKELCRYYDRHLADLPVERQAITPDCDYNHAYYPVIFPSEELLLKVLEQFNLHNIFPRRYFFPALSCLPYVTGQSAPVAEDIARRILCLPLYHTLSREEIDMICRLLKRALRY
ncbi:MAG: DegT/DnrJ/EryC1/StrS family aminotransferase [Desulfuromonadales bacterium]|nr:DegT/DnrJ/EryC1/StrS family aminotransferase [Desulfuromonadales bacterium]